MENYDHNSSCSLFLDPSQTLLPHVFDCDDSLHHHFHGEFHPWPAPVEMVAGDRAVMASKSHSQAEKRRRDRINAQLTSLRKLIPKSDKMDKAALLGSVIERVKDLKRNAMEVSKSTALPTETDEITIEYDLNARDESLKLKDNVVIKASVCCEDRPELFSELIHVLKGLRLTAVKAEIASVGGRIKGTLLLCSKDSEKGVCLTTLKHSLKSVVTKMASSSVATNCPTRSKRQRFFLPSHFI
ncbi:hypothetical protein PIB30_070161 [Stylosanthes scabra]|uniref:BHLH domain-containing protein n=1 Tax=Stylosanthes scabra TaxID=79078 RepID=A0ABU6SNI8_9FABA|nr:hypothetical protein [Stylosanthes scabra]